LPIGLLGLSWLFSRIKARPPATPTVPVEGELGDKKDLPADFLDRSVHRMLFIRENAQAKNLLCQVADLGLAISATHSEKKKESAIDLPRRLPVDFHTCPTHSLDDHSHNFKISNIREFVLTTDRFGDLRQALVGASWLPGTSGHGTHFFAKHLDTLLCTAKNLVATLQRPQAALILP
jgi:hypothetical protein